MAKTVLLAEMRDALKAKDRMGILAEVASRVADLLTRIVAIGQEAKSAATEVSRIVKSSGVKTHRIHNMSKAGRSRIATAQRRRWVAYRKAKLPKKAVSKIVAGKKRERSAVKAAVQ